MDHRLGSAGRDPGRLRPWRAHRHATRAPNPAAYDYETSDGRFLQLCFLQSDRFWPDLCRALGRSDLATDQRFVDHVAGQSTTRRAPLSWRRCSRAGPSTSGGWRSPTSGSRGLRTSDLTRWHEDPQVAANDYIVEIPGRNGETFRSRKAARLGATEDGDGRHRPARRLAGVDRRRPPRRRSRCRSTARRSSTARPSSSAASPRSPHRSHPTADLAPDQLDGGRATVPGPARIIAPAGSGKTRVLTERLRHLLADRGYEREAVRGARLQQEGPGGDGRAAARPGARIQTLNAWGYAHPQPLAGPPARGARRARGARHRRAARADAAAAGEHRPDRAVHRRALAHPPRPARPEEVEDTLDDVARPGRRLRPVPRGAPPPAA